MKKTGILLSILLTLSLPLFASPSWIGVQALNWQSDQSATSTYMGLSSTSSGTHEGVGLIISGSLYPDSDYGLGFQFGATKESSSDDADPPLTWRGALTTQYGSSISDFLSLEFGAGILYEQLTKTDVSSGTEKITVKSYSLYSSTTLALHFEGNLSLIGGLSMAMPLYTKAEVTSGGVTTQPDMQVTGFSFEALIGIALGI